MAARTATVDQFVYAGPERPGKIALNFAKGTLRFVTGYASHEAYTINTPTAALGLRGTILNVASSPSRTIVDLVEGAVHVCVRSPAHRRCVELTRPGQEAVVTVTQVAVTAGSSGGPGTTGSAATTGGTTHGADPSPAVGHHGGDPAPGSRERPAPDLA
jgi:hypothetical protein